MKASGQTATRILLVDDHELFRTGIAGLLDKQPDLQVVGHAGDGLEAHYRAAALKPDLILMDINMPGVDGLEALQMIKSDLPNTTIIMLTIHDEDEKVFKALRTGAKGYILKNTNSSEFLSMLRNILDGEPALSPKLASRVISEFSRMPSNHPTPPGNGSNSINLTIREKEVLSYMSEDLTDKEIAMHLSVSIHTVKSHVRNILTKLKVKNRRAAAQFARNQGLTK
ncbi:MAG: response regulator transcription factor [Anaerolineae bacterium]|nr:response regulator transcription factor [Anaerolineae bacterium]